MWTPRSHICIQIADHASKRQFSSDEHRPPRPLLSKIFSLLECVPSVDGFAHTTNTVCSKYATIFPVNINETVNFFTMDLVPEHCYYLNPPIALIPAMLVRISLYPEINGIICVPHWPSANFWPLLFPTFKPHIVKIEFCQTKSINFSKVPNFLCENVVTIMFIKFSIK